ncbi:hypothetical protein BLNAU_13967 [Blattamonas nauphoetae]|uniref:Uncharacterized protein n=1 Tax=Blattamonas nauphoetae TaxID=2049346 RepID=A0ABQ9XHE4_9EUKA|nr:hypothetical protein BLNAU_13967 [Blattamonas nauphoetae]
MIKDSITQSVVQLISALNTEVSLFLIALFFTLKGGTDFTITFCREEQVEEVTEVTVEDKTADEDTAFEVESENELFV